jgi:transposase
MLAGPVSSYHGAGWRSGGLTVGRRCSILCAGSKTAPAAQAKDRNVKEAMTVGSHHPPAVKVEAGVSIGGGSIIADKAGQRSDKQAYLRARGQSVAPVISCYGAGREGFWLHRCLLASGIENRVVGSASIEVVPGRAQHLLTGRIAPARIVR